MIEGANCGKRDGFEGRSQNSPGARIPKSPGMEGIEGTKVGECGQCGKFREELNGWNAENAVLLFSRSRSCVKAKGTLGRFPISF